MKQPLKYYLNKARKQGWAVGQFNFSTLEQLRGILGAAQKLKSPVILGTSEGESNFLGLEETIALFEISRMKYNVSAYLHFDHGKDIDLIKRAVDFGYLSIHFDGSGLSFEENIEKTKKVVKYAHSRGVLVEGELGYIRGSSEAYKKKIKIKKEDLTSPEQVFQFVKETGVDSLAISIGNVHGIYKGQPRLDFERLKEISRKTNAFLVLHGGSGIPQKEIKKAIALDIIKININTELRVVWKESLKKMRSEIKPYKVLSQAQKSIQEKVEQKIKLFGSNNKI